MKITRDIVEDLYPLYISDACSSDSRALVEQYLREHPTDAETWRRLAETPASLPPPDGHAQGTAALIEARRRLNARSWLQALAIFFTLVPFSFYVNEEKSWWFLREAPGAAATYGLIGLIFWIAYFRNRSKNRGL